MSKDYLPHPIPDATCDFCGSTEEVELWPWRSVIVNACWKCASSWDEKEKLKDETMKMTQAMNIKVNDALARIEVEVQRAKSLHPGDFYNQHEALGVIREEYIELEREIFKNKREYSKEKASEEAVQLAAMCVRFISELGV